MAEPGPPRYECDLVMKGGITSGIVYPPAIVEIARDHRLRSIGGSSAGAIAAVCAAAAELGRSSTTGGFALLDTLPARLRETDASGRTMLQRLFQAQPATADLFDLFWLTRSTTGTARIWAIVRRLRSRGKVATAIDAAGAAAVFVSVVLVAASARLHQWWGLAAAALLAVVAGGLWWVGRQLGRTWTGARSLVAGAPAAVAGNFHGICNGRSSPVPSNAEQPGVTEWLHTMIQQLAGRGDDGVAPELAARPVTYGDLNAAGIELVTMTTDLTHGTPEAFPFGEGGWAFDEAELRTLLPAPVVDQLCATGVTPTDPERAAALAAGGLRPLPPAADLPIVLGARVSLSFPLLLSGVPLHAWSPVPKGDGWSMEYVRCWLSDGGITSNLPVHLFDKPLPGRPTYAINLGSGPTDPEDCKNVWRPLTAGSGRLAGTGRIDTTLQFLAAVFDTMQNWSDNALIRSPGYRDRICTVRLGAGEGGMNLDMSPTTIDRLARRGGLAGTNLAWMQRGGAQPCWTQAGLSAKALSHQWDRHRFIRYRTFAGGLAHYLSDARTGYAGPGAYPALLASAVTDPWFPYRRNWTEPRRAAVVAELQTTFDLDLDQLADGTPAGAALAFDPRAANRSAGPDPTA